GVEGRASVRWFAELRRGECFGIQVPAFGQATGRRVIELSVRAALGHGGAVVVGGRRVVDRRDRNRDGGRGAALGVGDWWRARREIGRAPCRERVEVWVAAVSA